MASLAIGNFKSSVEQDPELSLLVSKTLAPWEAANRIAVFFDAWLDAELRQRGSNVEDLNYVVNELMENAVKYADDGTIELSVCLETQALRLSLTHPISDDHAKRYRTLAEALVARDPDELFAEIIESNALSDGLAAKGAGLGLVTLRQNYQAQLGFAFDMLSPNTMQVTTQVSLPWPHIATVSVLSH